MSIVSPRYFAMMQIPLLEGRDFTEQDDEKSSLVGIINETMAKRFWPGQNPVGRKFHMWRGDVTVVGMVKAGKYRSLNEPPKCFFYLAYQQGVWDLNLGVGVRTEGDPRLFAQVLRDRVHALDPGVEVWALLTMVDYVQAAFLAQRITSIMLTGLGLVALILAAMGIYGVMAYVMNQRTHEIGIRMALGARIRDVIGLVLQEGLWLTGWGVLAGLAGALAVTRWLANFLYGVSPFDPLTFWRCRSC